MGIAFSPCYAPRVAKTEKISKTRADVALVERGLADSRTRAQALILAGLVFSGEQRVNKAGDNIASDAPLELRGQDHPWVSRGGLKLDHALEELGIDVTGAVGIDVGASTGGFTDVLLTRGAKRVYAVDVGHGQFAWKLRNDDRVVVLEKTNARHLTDEHIPEPVDVIVCDASFIGLAGGVARRDGVGRARRAPYRADQTPVRGWQGRCGQEGCGARSRAA